MGKNVHPIDRAIRIILGFGLLSLIFFVDSDYRWFGLIGLIPLITGLVGFCPLYRIFGLSGCKK